MAKLAADVDTWSGMLPDSSVMVLFLGDNVYEKGIRDLDHPGYDSDTLRLNTQIRVVTGPNARAAGTRAVFLPGNHDWGNTSGAEGLARIRNMATHLDGVADPDTAQLVLLPEPGATGPTSVDLGSTARVLALDGQLLLQSMNQPAADSTLARIEEHLGSTERHIVIASHLPLLTGGPHGGAIPFFPTLGLHYLAHKSGILVQDVTSRPYRSLVHGFEDLFERQGVPLALVGGHDHSMQVLSDTIPGGGELLQLVSGAGSRLTHIRDTRQMEWGRSAPGYMRITLLENGGAHLSVVLGAVSHLECPEPGTEANARCMTAGADSIHTAYLRRLR